MPRRLVTVAAVVLFVLALPSVAKAAGDPLLYAVQEALTDEGYDPGWPDGVLGPRTREAIRAFEADYSLPVTGMMSPDLVYALGLAAYATELGVMQFETVRTLAPPPGAGRFSVSGDAAADSRQDAGLRPRALQPAAGAGRPDPPAVGAAEGQQVLRPVFRVRDFHPLMPDAAQTGASRDRAATPGRIEVAGAAADGAAKAGAAPLPVPPDTLETRGAGDKVASAPAAAVDQRPAREKQAAARPLIPPVEDRFAPRNWLIRDFRPDGGPAGPAFGVFLEEGGKVAGPRFAARLRWEADGARFTMIYRNGIGQEIRRTGLLNGLNRIDGEAAGPGGKTWRWSAEAKPL